jgi:predicted nucleic acid-binding protein
MASARPTKERRVFLDSSVLIAASISATGSARELLRRGFRGQLELVLSSLVWDETERNLADKAPAALPAFALFRATLPARIVRVTKSGTARAARVVVTKDAAIVAGAVQAKAAYLATFDRRHLLAKQTRSTHTLECTWRRRTRSWGV